MNCVRDGNLLRAIPLIYSESTGVLTKLIKVFSDSVLNSVQILSSNPLNPPVYQKNLTSESLDLEIQFSLDWKAMQKLQI